MFDYLAYALRHCPPLREAVFRNRTPDRVLRRAVSLACLPVATFTAVVAWLPPWDIVPAAEACAKVEALHINPRTGSHREALQIMTEAAVIIFDAIAAAPFLGSPAPFSKVKTLELPFTYLVDDKYRQAVEFYDTAVWRMLLQLPALQHLQVYPLFDEVQMMKPADFWITGAEIGGGAEAIEIIKRSPSLTSLDLCDNNLDMSGVFFVSFLLCRGTVKQVVWSFPYAIKHLISPCAFDTRTADFSIRVADDAPASPDLSDITANHFGCFTVPRVPVHWTLEKFVMCNSGGPELAVTDLLLLVRMCPRLKELHIACCQTWLSEEPLMLGWASRRVHLDDGSAVPVIVEDVAFSRDQKPLAGFSRPALNALAIAHSCVKELLSVYKAHVTAPPPATLLPAAKTTTSVPRCNEQQIAALGRIVAEGTYPAALLWALCRGLEHTSLTSLRLRGSLADGPAEEAAAVIVLAARMRRKQ